MATNQHCVTLQNPFTLIYLGSCLVSKFSENIFNKIFSGRQYLQGVKILQLSCDWPRLHRQGVVGGLVQPKLKMGMESYPETSGEFPRSDAAISLRTFYWSQWLRKCPGLCQNALLFNPLNAELNPICHLLALLGAHHILHVSRTRVNVIYWVAFSNFTFSEPSIVLHKREKDQKVTIFFYRCSIHSGMYIVHSPKNALFIKLGKV